MPNTATQFSYLAVHTPWGHGGPGAADDYAALAAELGCPALACADYGTVAAWPAFAAALKEHNVRPIFGLACDVLLDAAFAPENDERPMQPITLLAANNSGLANLVTLHNLMLRERDGRCWCSLQDLATHAAGAWVIVQPQGEFASSPLAALPRKRAVALLEALREALPSPQILLLGLTPGAEQEHFADLAAAANVPSVALPVVRYPDAAGRAAHLALYPRAAWDQEAVQALAAPDAVASRYTAYPDALDLAAAVAESCAAALESLRLGEMPELDEQLRALAGEALAAAAASPDHELEVELRAVAEMDLAAQLLAAREVVSTARALGLYLGAASGVAASGRLPELLGIAPKNPFGTAAAWLDEGVRRDRLAPGLKVATLARPALLRRLASEELPLLPVAASRALGFTEALRLAGAALSLDPGVIADLVRLSAAAADGDAALRKAQDKIAPDAVDLNALLALVTALAGSPQAVLPDGEIVVALPPGAIVPLRRDEDGGQFCAWDAPTLEGLNLPLLLLTGDPGLDTVQRAAELAGPLESLQTDELRLVITAGDSAGLPLVLLAAPDGGEGKTPGVLAADAAALLPDENADKLGWATLGALLCGPRGPHPWLAQFVRRRVGGQPFLTSLHPALQSILEPTCGLPLFAEQIDAADLRLRQSDAVDASTSLTLHSWLSSGEAYTMPYGEALAAGELLHAALNLKAAHPAAYIAAAMQHALAESDSNALHRLVLEAQRHEIALLPPDVRVSQPGFSVETLVRQHAATVSADPRYVAQNSKVAEEAPLYAVRWGLALSLRLLPAARAIAVAQAAAAEPFATLEEFCVELDPEVVTADMLEELIRAGALDYLGRRPALLLDLPGALQKARRRRQLAEQAEAGPNQLDLFVGEEAPATEEAAPEEAAPEAETAAPAAPQVEPGVWEAALLGHIFAPHPVISERLGDANRQARIARRTLAGVGVADAGESISMPVVLTSLDVIPAGNDRNERMAMAWAEDSTGRLPLLLFPPTYTRYKALAQIGTAVVVTARVRLAEPWESSGSPVVLVCDHLAPFVVEQQAQKLDVTPIKKRPSAAAAMIEQRNKAAQPAAPAQSATPAPAPIPIRPREPEPPPAPPVSLPPWLRDNGPTVMLTLPLVDSPEEDDQRLRRLRRIMERHPGNTAVVLYFPEDPAVGMPTHMPLRNVKVNPSDEFCSEAGELLGAECVQVLNGGGNG